ncbi:MAG TPA: hypothetical protein VN193_00035 [Candidatus Angelobacter sp.]|jgi:hypothetical protein|nr:hypothetical protein [Candidatus Angelobacter sp.]
MATSRDRNPTHHPDMGPRLDALAAWYSVPVDTFDGFTESAVDKILDEIRDTPSRWAGIRRAAGQGS